MQSLPHILSESKPSVSAGLNGSTLPTLDDVLAEVKQCEVPTNVSPSTDSAAGGDADAEPTVSQTIASDLKQWGYNLWLNEMDDSVWNGDKKMADADRAILRMRARDDGYAQRRLLAALDDATLAIAAANSRHPVREYLNGLQWDGVDHIGRLSTYFDIEHQRITYDDGTERNVLDAFLRRWFVGAVAKIFGDASAARSNFMLVLAGKQNVGKSYFSEWLCPMSKDYYVEKSINTENKDVSILRTNKVVWEVGELGATTRKADVEALKMFITTTVVSERKAYGHVDTEKPAISSYIGTVNPDGSGFLSDSTGNRRFAVVEINGIQHAYSKEMRANDLWAQAVAMWRADPESYCMSAEEREVGAKNAEKHMPLDVYGDMMATVFEFDPMRLDWKMSSTEALNALRTYAGLSKGNEIAQGRELSKSLRKHWGIEGTRRGSGTVYSGMRLAERWAV